MSDARRTWVITVLVSALAISVRLLAIEPYTPLGGDEIDYHGLATRLSEGRGYVTDAGTPTALRMPAWPWTLAFVYSIVGPNPDWGRRFTATIDGLTAGLIFLLGAILTGSTVWGTVAGLLWALNPYNLSMSEKLLCEPLAALLVSLLVLCFLTRKGTLLPGLLLGLASLTRPYLVPTVIPWGLWVARRGRRALGVFLLGWAVVVGSWMTRNYLVLGSWTITTLAEGFWDGNNQWARGAWPGLPAHEAGVQLLRQRYPTWDSLGEVEQARIYRHEGIQEVLTHPDRFFWLVPRKVIILLWPFSRYMRTNWLYLALVPFWALGLWALYRGGEKRHLLWLFLGPLMAAIAVVVVTFGDPRFRYPSEPLVLPVAVYGVRMALSRRLKAS